ncbi:MAG: DUF2497 domain-containing protein [Xanthobacteraceae bacterium]|nr:DUF2497 domain-containing protein [Xanthobacteraceae bacterium]
MTQPAKIQEPSMEEILASIRRIIADDEAETPAQPPAAQAAPGAAAASARVLPASKPAAKPASQGEADIAALMADFDAPAAPPAPEDDVLELTDDMALPAPPDTIAADMSDLDFDKVEPANDREFNEIAMTSEHRYPAVERPSGADRGGDGPAASEMLSRSTVSAVESAFNSLAHTVLSNNARTLEDLVREMLRPMLKSWLDDNLPGLVERIVKAEIERVSRGR